MTKKRRTYQPRVFEGRIIMSDEIERIHKEVLKFERIEAVSDPMRELIEDLWPELVHKLRRRSPPVRRNQSSVVSQFEFKLRHYPEFISGDRGADMC
jgi:hypothetical protein